MNEEHIPQILNADIPDSSEFREVDTPQLEEFMNRYIDLNTNAFDPQASDEDRTAIAVEINELRSILERCIGLSPEFAKEMIPQLKRIEEGFFCLKKLHLAVRNLERESVGGVMVPHLLQNTIRLLEEARSAGVKDSVLEYLAPQIRNYATMVKGAQGQ